jgi:hypothetical protein
MYVDVTFASSAMADYAAVPAAALQRIGSRAVVYVKHPSRERTFIVRKVEPREREGEYVLIRSGVSEGELVVATGSFSIRAQRERGAGHATAGAPASPAAGIASSAAKELFDSYEQLRRALAENRFDRGHAALARLVTLARTAAPAAATPASALAGAANLDDAREHFGALRKRWCRSSGSLPFRIHTRICVPCGRNHRRSVAQRRVIRITALRCWIVVCRRTSLVPAAVSGDPRADPGPALRPRETSSSLLPFGSASGYADSSPSSRRVPPPRFGGDDE